MTVRDMTVQDMTIRYTTRYDREFCRQHSFHVMTCSILVRAVSKINFHEIKSRQDCPIPCYDLQYLVLLVLTKVSKINFPEISSRQDCPSSSANCLRGLGRWLRVHSLGKTIWKQKLGRWPVRIWKEATCQSLDVVKYLKMVNLETGKSNCVESIKLARNLNKRRNKVEENSKGCFG